MSDTYTASREASQRPIVDFDIDRIVPPLAYQPIEGEETTSPDGVRMTVDRVTEYEQYICVAGRAIGENKWKKKDQSHCFLYRFVRYP